MRFWLWPASDARPADRGELAATGTMKRKGLSKHHHPPGLARHAQRRSVLETRAGRTETLRYPHPHMEMPVVNQAAPSWCCVGMQAARRARRARAQRAVSAVSAVWHGAPSRRPERLAARWEGGQQTKHRSLPTASTGPREPGSIGGEFGSARWRSWATRTPRAAERRSGLNLPPSRRSCIVQRPPVLDCVLSRQCLPDWRGRGRAGSSNPAH